MGLHLWRVGFDNDLIFHATRKRYNERERKRGQGGKERERASTGTTANAKLQ